MSVSTSSRFDSLPTRPPTPPRDPREDVDREINAAIEFLDDSFEVERLKSSLPPTSSFDDSSQFTPPSSGGPILDGSSKKRKRVLFSAWTNYHKDLDIANLKPLPRTPTALKSILKAHEPVPNLDSTEQIKSTTLPSAFEFDSFQTMLDALIKQLAETKIDARRDAYQTLQGAIKHYGEVPGGVDALAEKMTLLMQFIERDMDTVDIMMSQLAQKAVTLTAALLRIPVAEAAMDDDFRTFLVDRAIALLSSPTTPKVFVNHGFILLAHQKFSHKILTEKKVEKILEALSNIQDRVKGNSVVGNRLQIYKRLISHVPTTMGSKISMWLEQMIHAMLSNRQEVRAVAINLGLLAAKELSSSKHSYKAISDILNRDIGEGQQYSDFLAERLEKMCGNENEAWQAPQIWTIIILFTKERPKTLDSWRPFKTWLLLFEKFVRNTDPKVIQQTTVAWNRFIYLVFLKDTITPRMSKLLKQVSRTWLHEDRAPKGRHMKVMGYYTLLYYALRPGSTAEYRATSWQEYLNHILADRPHPNWQDGNFTSLILSNLLRRGQTKIWNESKVFEHQPAALIEDLPPLDSRWIRARISLVLKPVKFCLNLATWTTDKTPSPKVRNVWLNLMEALAEANNKEVTASMELKDALAQVMNLLHGICSEYPSSLSDHAGDGNVWMERFGFLIQSAIQSFGALYFGDKNLARNGQADFEPAPTPSHRSRTQSSLHSPLLHLLSLILRVGPDDITDKVRLATMELMILPCLEARNSVQSKADLLRDCAMETLPLVRERPISSGLWQTLASLTTSMLNASAPQSPPPRQLYPAIVDILGLGASIFDPQSRKATDDLFLALTSIVTRDVGSSAVVLAVTEPLASLVHKQDMGNTLDVQLHMSTLILENLSHPKNQRALRQAHEALGTSSGATNKSADFDPYHNLYNMVDLILSSAYESLTTASKVQIQPLMSALITCIRTCPNSLVGLFLRKVQTPLALWVADQGRCLTNVKDSSRGLLQEVFALWKVIIHCIQMLPHKDSSTLAALDILIAAGFSSSHRDIINQTIDLWNASFGKQDALDYPEVVIDPLRKLKRVAEIDLPTFPHADDDEEQITLSFLDSQDDSFLHPEIKVSAKKPPKLSHLSPTKKRSSPKRSVSRTPSKKTPRSKLRHDDSQIQFAAIDSSPLNPNKNESQILTEHQKEINEKQRHEAAAMFPDIASTPSIPLNEARPDSSRLNIMSSRQRETAHERSPSHILTPSKSGPLDAFVGSSPTPAPGGRSRSASSSRYRARAADPPSSPPRSSPLKKHQTKSEMSRTSDDIVKDSFDQREPISTAEFLEEEQAQTHNTIQSGSVTAAERTEVPFEDEDIATMNMPSSDDYDDDTMDVDVTSSDQDALLNAQIVNEIQAHEVRSTPRSKQTAIMDEVFVDASSELPASDDTDEIEFVDASPNLIESSNPDDLSARLKLTSPQLQLAPSVHLDNPLEASSQVESSPVELDSKHEEQSEDLISPRATRSQGRKRKSTSVYSTASKKARLEVQAKERVEKAAANTQPAQPRKRGRPRKNPRPSEVAIESIEMQESADATDNSSLVSERRPSLESVSASVASSALAPTGSQSKHLSHIQIAPRSTRENHDHTFAPARIEMEDVGSSAIGDRVVDDADNENASTPTIPATPSRRILQPKSIIDRLKGFLTDMKSYAFGTVEEYHEADSLIAEMRREAFGASMRGEQQQMLGYQL